MPQPLGNNVTIDSELRETLEAAAANAPALDTEAARRVVRHERRRRHRRLAVAAVTMAAVSGASAATLASVTGPRQQQLGTATNASNGCRHSLPSPSPAVLHSVNMNLVAERLGRLIETYPPTVTFPHSSHQGIPYGLAAGIIGEFGVVDKGFTVVVDPRVVDRTAVLAAIHRVIPPAAYSTVRVDNGCVSVKAIVSAWEWLTQRDWAPDAHQASFAMVVNPATEKIDVSIDDAHLATLRAAAPAVVHVTAGGFVRLSSPAAANH